jgi:hypothetical protein
MPHMRFTSRLAARGVSVATACVAAVLIVAAALWAPSSAAAAEAGAVSLEAVAASSPSKTVPNVVGKTASDAKAVLKKSGLGYRYVPPKGSVVILSKNWTVTKQSPKAGATVKAGTKIKLNVVKTPRVTASSSPASPSPTPAAPQLSVAQEQAILAARNYLSSGMGFSRQGLIDQLSSPYGNGFAVADATTAVDSLNADWNAQAVTAARAYLSMGQGFSHQSLVEQLSSEYGNKFTPEQAEYAAGQVGL